MIEKIYEDDVIEVLVLDAKGAGGARHKYSIVCKEPDPEKGGQLELAHIEFQKGNRIENGVNGVTNEALLAIVEHRCSDFMEGPFPHPLTENAQRGSAFALACLEQRTAERQARGVEGQEKA